jgi:hypothetical protein
MYLNEVFLTYLNYPIYLTYVIYQSIKSINSSLISPHPIWHDLHSNQIYSCLTKSNQIWSSVFTFCMHSVCILYAFYMHSVCILCFYMERPVASKRRHPVCARCCATLARPGKKCDHLAAPGAEYRWVPFLHPEGPTKPTKPTKCQSHI